MNNLSEYDKATEAILNVSDEKELIRLNHYLLDRIKMIRAAKSRAMKMSLNEGDTVRWTGKRGNQHGTVVSIKRKYAHIDVGTGTWRVPMNMLHKV